MYGSGFLLIQFPFRFPGAAKADDPPYMVAHGVHHDIRLALPVQERLPTSLTIVSPGVFLD
jgi:hypothetical protein